MNQVQHAHRHTLLHTKLCELVEDYVMCSKGNILKDSIVDLMTWSYQQSTQVINPTYRDHRILTARGPRRPLQP